MLVVEGVGEAMGEPWRMAVVRLVVMDMHYAMARDISTAGGSHDTTCGLFFLVPFIVLVCYYSRLVPCTLTCLQYQHWGTVMAPYMEWMDKLRYRSPA